MPFYRRAVPSAAAALALTALLSATPALAVDPNDPDLPMPSPTTTSCAEGTVWDPEDKKCRDPDSAALSNDARYAAARELAHAGRFKDAGKAIDSMTEGATDRVLTYRGFLLRKSGSPERARAAYDAALSLNPDNILARSYLGQGLLAAGDRAGARAQLSEIRRRGGRDTWAEVSLRLALGSGASLGY